MTASISILKKIKPPLRWEPEPREFTQEFLESKGKGPNGPSYDELTSGEDSVLHEAQRILGRCLPPTEAAGRETGLVVGYVHGCAPSRYGRRVRSDTRRLRRCSHRGRADQGG